MALFRFSYSSSNFFNIINKEKRIGVHFNKVVDVIRRELVERLYDIENDNFKQMQTTLATLLSRATDLDMLVLNQLVVLATSCNTFNSNQIGN